MNSSLEYILYDSSDYDVQITRRMYVWMYVKYSRIRIVECAVVNAFSLTV